jgi:tRNA A-37 threonylcarbamoyl transferase component Bud32
MKSLTMVELARRMGATSVPDPAQLANIVELADGTVLKLFRKGSRIANLRCSRARRFARSARRLRERGLCTVDVLDVLRVNELGREGVIYRPLPGTDVRQCVRSVSASLEVLGAFARLAAKLHRKGVYCRSLHLGNVILMDGGSLGLVDVADTSFGKTSLGVAKRVRNFRPILRYPEQSLAIERYGPSRFIGSYLEESGLIRHAKAALVGSLRGKYALFADLAPVPGG